MTQPRSGFKMGPRRPVQIRHNLASSPDPASRLGSNARLNSHLAAPKRGVRDDQAAGSANQCKNDRDGTVDSDERLRITDTPPGRYDAKLVDVSKRTCIVRNLELKTGEIFSIEEKELTSCTQ